MKQAFVNVNGLNMRYLEAGNAIGTVDALEVATVDENASEKRHVLFIHGLGSSADRWLDIPDALSLLGLHSVALDLPGFGLSDKPEDMDYTIGRFVQVVADFMRKVGMHQGRTSIVGHSLGGYIAAQLAAEHRDLVDRLILIDTSGMLDGPTPLLQQYLDAAMKPSKQSVRAVLEQLVADPMRIPEVLVDGFIYRMGQPGARHAFKSAFDKSVNTQIGAGRLGQIGEGKIPTLIVWGRQDRLIPLEYFRAFQEAISGSSVVIVEDAGHAPFAEKPAIVCELLHRFLTAPKSGATS
ncbi:MAG TPA: alpha/beta hydrolase [Nitrososphaera sp.]|nr:alpha/beta hydrolase [Nitrososphaera sp.]